MTADVWVHRSLLSRLASSMMTVSTVCGRSLEKVWEGLSWEGLVAFSGSEGCCGIAHDSQHLECAEEVWAALQALLPFTERTSSPQGDSGLWVPPPSGDDPSRCLVWFAHDGRRKMPFCPVVAFLLIWETCGSVAAQEALIGAATSVTGQVAKVHLS